MVTHEQYKRMASLPLTTVTTAYSFSSSTTNLSSLPSRHFFVKPRQCLICGKRNHRFQVSCKNMHGGDQNPNANSNNNGQTSVGKFDRRNVLLGLGGLYGAANLVLSDPSALAAPVQAPDIAECHDVSESDVPPEGSHCCPPTAVKICDYELPKFNSLRTRRAAHEALVDQEYLAKFSHGIELLKNLPADHPHNFMQQANVHCAYCNGAYYQVGFPGVDIQVHFSWLFFPFHRWYLYFFERIMAKHLGDETFALPFWNWDAPDGMTFPPNMVDPKSPLYDALRNPKHLSPTIIDLGYGGTDTDKPDDLKIKCNLSLMHTQMVKNSSRPLLFLGGPYYAGDKSSPGSGSIERCPHNQVHNWVGTNKEFYEDMGNFYSAARDPVFYMHHANIDRMWTIRNTNIIGSERHTDTAHTNFMDPQWLNASFVFYDEDEKPVRVKVGDCRDNRKLGYEYEDVPRPWEHFKPVPRVKKSRIATTVDLLTLNDFPIDLSKGTAKFLVNRPRRSRTVKEKDDEEEVLVIGGIKFHSDDYVVFDVFVNTEDEAVIDKCDAEYASTFSSLPHKHNATDKRMMTNLRIGLNQILEDLEAEDDDKVLVSLVPQSVGKGVHILAAHIEFMG